ncbi:MAG: hypothetical protein QNK23_08555 [Crocinitomicaceae bacterium]|nr:hypothetical protein [Crocinitomicaceae bacterium]
MKNLLLIPFFTITLIAHAQWNQLGNDVGASARNFKLNGDGTEVALGNQFDDTYGVDRGVVTVMEWDGVSWIQKGSDIYGASEGDKITILDFSNDGNLLLVASVMGYYAVIYEWNGIDWMIKGSEVNLQWPFCIAGSISNNGLTFAVGSEYADLPPMNDVGSAKVFAWDGTAWSQQGATFTGTGLGGHLGSSVSLSEDGNRLAIGEDYDNSGNTGVGKVKVYDWNGIGWVLVGAIMEGNGPYRFGYVVDLSADGNSIAISEPRFYNNGYAGQVFVYEWNGSTWDQQGITIDNPFSGVEDFGLDIDFTDDGQHLIVGAKFAQSTIGAAVTYVWNGTVWIQYGSSIPGNGAYDWFGEKVAISEDAAIVAGQTNSPGVVRVYEDMFAGTEEEIIETNKSIERVVDLLGREVSIKPNTCLIYIYDDGSAEKVFIVE